MEYWPARSLSSLWSRLLGGIFKSREGGQICVAHRHYFVTAAGEICSAAATSHPVLRFKPDNSPEMLCVVRHEYQSQRHGMGGYEGVKRPDGHAAVNQGYGHGGKTIRRRLVEGGNRYSFRK